MILEQFSRTELLLGKKAVERLNKAHVAVFGVGGVGGYAVEALVRAGIGMIDLIDNDVVSLSNINRQIVATHKTVGQYKVDVMATRIKEINPDCQIQTHKLFYSPENENQFNLSHYNYVIDAIDTVTSKISLIMNAKRENVPIISAMGAGNKLDPTAFEVSDIFQTSVCPLAHIMRKELKKRSIQELKVVYSREKPIKVSAEDMTFHGKHTPGSISFVPSVVGLIIASEVIKDLIQ